MIDSALGTTRSTLQWFGYNRKAHSPEYLRLRLRRCNPRARLAYPRFVDHPFAALLPFVEGKNAELITRQSRYASAQRSCPAFAVLRGVERIHLDALLPGPWSNVRLGHRLDFTRIPRGKIEDAFQP